MTGRLKLPVVGVPYPKCFGKLWAAEAVECKGGHDPYYVAKPGETKNHRPKCWFFNTCRVEVPAKSAARY